MSWYAKPSDPYSINSTEGLANIHETNNFLTGYGFTTESIAGMLGNIYAESGLNPWRWQGDIVDYSLGYGLFQYSPASEYLRDGTSYPNYSPNLSVTEVTSGATPEDAEAQLAVFAENRLNKWVSLCWRDYWSKRLYPDLFAVRRRIIAEYGADDSLPLDGFKQITNVYDATFAFLACFEGAWIPNQDARYGFASTIYEILTGHPPTPPPPTPTKKKRMPLWMYLRSDDYGY